jgi:hypothetical protein
MLRIMACDVSFGHHNPTCSSTDSFSARKQPKLMIRKAANYYIQELCDDISRKAQKRRSTISRKLSLKDPLLASDKRLRNAFAARPQERGVEGKETERETDTNLLLRIYYFFSIATTKI